MANLKRMSVDERFREVHRHVGHHVKLSMREGGQAKHVMDARVFGAAMPWLDGNSTGVLVYQDQANLQLGVVALCRIIEIERL